MPKRTNDIERIAEQFTELIAEERVILQTLRRIREAKALAISLLAEKTSEFYRAVGAKRRRERR